MQALRKILCWLFGLDCLGFIVAPAVLYLVNPFHRNLISAWELGTIAAFLGLWVAPAVILGLAWWTLWRRKATSRGWAIAASLVNLLQWTPFAFSGPDWAHAHLRFILTHSSIGIAGLVAFVHSGGTTEDTRRGKAQEQDMSQPTSSADEVQAVMRRLRFICANFVVGGVLLIWVAEQIVGRRSLPFSNWYFAFIAYAIYVPFGGLYLRRRFTSDLRKPDLSVSSRVKLWQTREIVGMGFAMSLIVCFCFARLFLRMSVWFSIPWYGLGFFGFILWRPSLPEALTEPNVETGAISS